MDFFKIQLLKTKRTSIILITLLVPILLISIFSFLAYFSNQTEFKIYKVTTSQLFFQAGFPLALALIIGLYFRMERRDNAFQNTIIYFGDFKKYYIKNFIYYHFLSFIMITISYLLTALFFIMFTQNISFFTFDYIYRYILLLIVCLPITSFIYFLNYTFNSFIISSLISFILIIGNFFVGVLGTYGSYIYFFSYPIFILYHGYNNLFISIMSILFTILFLFLGYSIFLKHMEKGKL